ncbi:hypothetical protein HYFRA_00007969 [Hymenoscyphus fraxineus]|uniref:Uncharacterized protein n=1 Tax=Hymenoscyphus fraxineus TaxID=746836 RepID=A0A9N9KTD5_9HELO|nr:hypothetical protein HYFRA_00007969 [Hymenoscyphus fraxineus]
MRRELFEAKEQAGDLNIKKRFPAGASPSPSDQARGARGGRKSSASPEFLAVTGQNIRRSMRDNGMGI